MILSIILTILGILCLVIAFIIFLLTLTGAEGGFSEAITLLLIGLFIFFMKSQMGIVRSDHRIEPILTIEVKNGVADTTFIYK